MWIDENYDNKWNSYTDLWDMQKDDIKFESRIKELEDEEYDFDDEE